MTNLLFTLTDFRQHRKRFKVIYSVCTIVSKHHDTNDRHQHQHHYHFHHRVTFRHDSLVRFECIELCWINRKSACGHRSFGHQVCDVYPMRHAIEVGPVCKQTAPDFASHMCSAFIGHLLLSRFRIFSGLRHTHRKLLAM